MSKSLNIRLTIGILAGLLLGILFAFDILPSTFWGINFVEILRLIGKTFMLLLKMSVVPLVFFSIFVGVTSLKNTARLGKLGIRTIIYYFCTTFIAVILGLILVNIIEPGKSFSLNIAFAPLEEIKSLGLTEAIALQVTSFIKNPFEALASGTESMIAIIITSIVLGIAVLNVPGRGKRIIIDIMTVLNDAVLWIIKRILYLAPYGIFGILVCLLYDEKSHLPDIASSLFLFAITSYLGLAIHGIIILPTILKIFTKHSIIRFFKGISEALKVAFGTDSSIATMPVTLTNLQENLGVSKRTSNFVIPLGATINMDGTALYEAVCAIFIAQALNIELTFIQQIIIFVTATIASVGAAGIPSAGLVTLVIVINAVGLPYEQSMPIIGMIFAIDRFIDVVRTMVNVEGDCVGCVIIDGMEMKEEAKG